MSHVYRVPMNTAPGFMLVQANTGPRAKASARDHVFGTGDATRLTHGQLMAAMKAGADILVIDADPVVEDGQADLPGMDEGLDLLADPDGDQ